MLVSLLNTPKNQSDWELFAFSNRDQINQIRKAILQQKGVNLIEYQVYPISAEAIQGFLEANQQAHSDFNSALGLPGSDLKEVDVRDERQLQAWTYLNYQELYSASAALGI